MSSQSYIYNPTERTLAAAGDGFSCPRLTTVGRTSLALTAGDNGMMVYDTTLNNLFIWTGAAWESVPASGDAGANAAVQYNDNGVVTGATGFSYNKATGEVSIPDNLIVPNGKGISFATTPEPAGMTSELFNDYEEGTFIPTIVAGAGTGTYTTQLGRYTKVGRIVSADIALTWTAHTGAGNMDIGGLPYSVLNTTGYSASAAIGYFDNVALTAGYVPIAALWWFNTTKIRLYQIPTGGGAAAGVPLDTAGQINLSITYIAA